MRRRRTICIPLARQRAQPPREPPQLLIKTLPSFPAQNQQAKALSDAAHPQPRQQYNNYSPVVRLAAAGPFPVKRRGCVLSLK